MPEKQPINPRQKILFDLGNIVSTPGALHLMRATDTNPLEILLRHATGDWGDLCDEDVATNQLALANGYRLMSVYHLRLIEPEIAPSSELSPVESHQVPSLKERRKTIWVITESDRSVTTFLLPQEY